MPRIGIDDKSLVRGERIKQMRESINLTQTDFGKLAGGYPQGTVYNWEAKGYPLPNYAIVALHKAGIDVFWLLTGEGEMERKESNNE